MTEKEIQAILANQTGRNGYSDLGFRSSGSAQTGGIANTPGSTAYTNTFNSTAGGLLKPDSDVGLAGSEGNASSSLANALVVNPTVAGTTASGNNYGGYTGNQIVKMEDYAFENDLNTEAVGLDASGNPMDLGDTAIDNTSWFSENKDMINAGMGLGQLGLAALNYNANKDLFNSQLKSEKQNRELKQARADNKTGMQDTFKSVWG